MDEFDKKLQEMEDKILLQGHNNTKKLVKDLMRVQDRLYFQLESLSWLQQRLSIKGQLPPLRGWASSPDVLLRLHTHIMATKPECVVECGSGASTMVIADALRQNGKGRLISLDHSEHYGQQTLSQLQAENLDDWVDLRIGELELWEGEHLNPVDAEKPSQWYPLRLLKGLNAVDLLWVDGPPGATCLFSRYPALPALAELLTPSAEVWMDDTVRQEEKDICEHWANQYGFVTEYLPLEKGLGRLTRAAIGKEVEAGMSGSATNSQFSEVQSARPAHELGFDFALQNENHIG